MMHTKNPTLDQPTTLEARHARCVQVLALIRELMDVSRSPHTTVRVAKRLELLEQLAQAWQAATGEPTPTSFGVGVCQARFELGQLVATPTAMETISWPELVVALDRHLQADWGECSAHDAAMNDEGLRRDLRLLSVYGTRSGARFWIITEADRSATTVLLPCEY